jgi:hypothetical protein
MQPSICSVMFQGNVLPPSSGCKSEPQGENGQWYRKWRTRAGTNLSRGLLFYTEDGDNSCLGNICTYIQCHVTEDNDPDTHHREKVTPHL